MHLYSRGLHLDLSFPHVMGILNVTPDSFFDGGMYNTVAKAIQHTNIMVKSGASIIDVGGESTRPGSEEVSVEEELDRVIPVINAIVKRFDVWISVDTSKPEVMRESAQSGVHLINDVRSLSKPGALDAAIEIALPICLMHNELNNAQAKKKSFPQNIINEVDFYLAKKIQWCRIGGIKKENILIDVGFGFGKNLDQNYNLLANLSHFHHFQLPLLVGISRKSMIGQLLNIDPSKRLNGSLSCAIIAAMQGANIIRVHDVKETVEAIHIVKKIRKSKGSNLL